MVSPFMAPQMQQQMAAPTPPESDPRALLAMLEELVGPVTPPQPRYKAGYTPPRKPKQEELWGRGQALKSKHQRLLDRFEQDRLWLQMALTGMFPEDVDASNRGLTVDQFQSTALAADWNMACAYLAELPFEPVKKMLRADLAVEARMVQDAVRFLRDEEIARFGDAWGADLAMEEARYLTIYGRIVNRTVLNVSNPDFPFDSTLIDPASVFFKDDGVQLQEAYHRYRTTYRRVIGTFGEPAPAELRKIKNDHGNEEYLDTECEVLDYWDSWYRSVVGDGATFVPVTAHEYGNVPFTVQFGPLGMPVTAATGSTELLQKNSGQLWVERGTLNDDMAQKGLSYIHYMRRTHAQYESVLARMLTGMKKAIDPPLLYERDDMAAMSGPPNRLNTGPGMQNETRLGQEKVSPIPTQASPAETNTLLTAITQDQHMAGLPPEFGGGNSTSNVSGVAQNGFTDSIMIKVGPWLQAEQRYHANRFSKWLEMWRNFGHLAQYGSGDTRTPLMIPTSNPRKGEQPAFELTRDLLDRVGPRIQINMTKPRTNQMLPIVNAYQGMVANGWATDNMAMEALGFTDFDRIREEWMEDKALKQALDHPKFVEGFTIPLALREAMREAEGDPEAQEGFKAAIQWWMENIVAPAQMQAQQAMQPPPQPGMGGPPQPGQLPGGPPVPGNSAGISLPQTTGQAPGTITGVQGGPPPPPPGSRLIPPGQPIQ